MIIHKTLSQMLCTCYLQCILEYGDMGIINPFYRWGNQGSRRSHDLAKGHKSTAGQRWDLKCALLISPKPLLKSRERWDVSAWNQRAAKWKVRVLGSDRKEGISLGLWRGERGSFLSSIITKLIMWQVQGQTLCTHCHVYFLQLPWDVITIAIIQRRKLRPREGVM